MQIIGAREKRCTLYFAGIFGDLSLRSHFPPAFLRESIRVGRDSCSAHPIIRFVEHERRSHDDLRGHVPTNPSRKSIESRERRGRRCSALRRAAPRNFRHKKKTVLSIARIWKSADQNLRSAKRPILLSRATRV